MLVEMGATAGHQLTKAVKEWKLTHGSVRAPSSPHSSLTVYKPQTGGYARSIVNADDPYWQEMYERNYRAEDRYKLPSAFAWDHKQHGLLGEVIDLKGFERKSQLIDKYL